ncbi:MAG TPA: MOSC and FAD-binding oxidoreductase domain-containing protein [Solirubrobacteraceae bacterium]|nr:MOSC and FAD-binding oxidoreductase domain-containing protein [Solirubrobacteraceae bacterium]
MRLLSVNVGRPRTVTWRGRPVRTSIWKEPVEGRRHVARLNVDGDAQADLVGHGGEHRAVFVYQLESYRYWEAVLGRELAGMGRFGENFTVEGLADDEVCIGDRLAIGSALFEVTQPRVTCFKVGIRLDEPRMPALLTGHGRPGFYLRVLREGEVGPGDAIVRVADGPGRLTVREASALLYTPGHDGDGLRRGLAIDALSEGWRLSFRRLLEQVESGRTGNSGLTDGSRERPAWPGFRRFRVADVVREATAVRSFALVPADGEPLAAHEPGQFVTLRVGDATRSYSLSAPADGRRLRVSVKREGRASSLLHDRVGAGDVVEVGAPRGDFVLDLTAQAPVVLISAGIGVTPLLAMLAGLAGAGSARPVTWVHVARCGAEHALAGEARRLLERLPQATSHVRYTRPAGTDRAGVDFDATGRLRAEHLAALGLAPDSEVFVCGPAAFMEAVGADLRGLGIPDRRVHTEAFGAARRDDAPPPHPPPGPPASGPAVAFARSAVTARFDDRWNSLLELAEACDVPADWSCRTGVCHRCESGLVSGSVDYDPEPLDPPPDGFALLCCSRPREAVTLDL